MRIIKPPECFDAFAVDLFMSGSIEQGSAPDWQTKLAADLTDIEGVALNPRRDAWDSSWEQSIDFEPFREQVQWELRGLLSARIVAIYFASGTQAPITLLELGISCKRKNAIVFCASDFWRRGNVETTCRFFGLPVYCDSYQGWLSTIRFALAMRKLGRER